MTPDYLYDPTDPPDPEVERLERLLRPLAHGPGPPPVASPTAAPRPPAGRRRAWLLLLGGLGAAAAAVVAGVLAGGSEGPGPVADAGPALAWVGGGRLGERAWVESGAERRELELGDVGRLTLDPHSRLEVRRLSHEETRLYLERGRLEARVSAEARPRFFQVDTPAARCVDLGCRYVLEVDAAGDARVSVLTGQVAFENEGREVYVPAGAVCRARRAGGAGTPRFEDAPVALATALDAYDEAAAAGAPAVRRRERAAEALAATGAGRDTLGAWHLLADPDDLIATWARARLTEVAAGPAPAPSGAGRPDAAERERWKEHLADAWW